MIARRGGEHIDGLIRWYCSEIRRQELGCALRRQGKRLRSRSHSCLCCTAPQANSALVLLYDAANNVKPEAGSFLALRCKERLKYLLLMSRGMPAPLSAITTRIPRRSGLRQSREANTCNASLPPAGVAASAFTNKLVNTCRSSVGAAWIMPLDVIALSHGDILFAKLAAKQLQSLIKQLRESHFLNLR